MSNLRQAAEAALEALEAALSDDQPYIERCKQTRTALRAALAEPEQEPEGYFSINDYGRWEENESEYGTPLYTAPPQRKPLTDEQVNECGMCGYVGKDKDKTGQCPKCRWDELRPLTGKAHQKPLTDDQIYEMYNEPRSDAEMLEFARAIEEAHGIKGEA